MLVHKQKLEDLLNGLSQLNTDWKDEFAKRVIASYERLEPITDLGTRNLQSLFDDDFEVGVTMARLFLEKSKDEFYSDWTAEFPEQGLNKARYLKNKETFLGQMDQLLVRSTIVSTVNQTYTWKDILTERLKAGRGSAIKGQARGRALEDFVESLVSSVFGDHYDSRCSFTGASGNSKEKADFAIPSKDHPQILIEVKAYGATGSKQTDVLGDVSRILEEKRQDTPFLLVTDGVTWKSRANDLRRLVSMQNKGDIYRIYTKSMKEDLQSDLAQMKLEKGL